MTKHERTLVDTLRYIDKNFGRETIYNEKKLLSFFRDLAPQLVGQREYAMLDNLLKCGGAGMLCDALSGTEFDRRQTSSRLVQRMTDTYAMDESSAKRICALFMAAVSGDDSYAGELDASEKQPRPAPRAPAPKAEKPSQPPRAPAAEAETLSPAQRQTARRRPGWKLYVAIIAVVCLCAAIFAVISKHNNTEAALEEQTLIDDELMVRRWLDVNDRVLNDMNSTGFDYLNSNGMEKFVDFFNENGDDYGIYFQKNDYEKGVQIDIYPGELKITPSDYDFVVLYLRDKKNTEVVNVESHHSGNIQVAMLTSQISSGGCQSFKPFLPKFAVDIIDMSRADMLHYLGITDEMLTWLNDTDKCSLAFDEYTPANYTACCPKFTLGSTNEVRHIPYYSELYFNVRCVNDSGNDVWVQVSIYFDEENVSHVDFAYEF